MRFIVACCIMSGLLSGCIAKSALDLATAPVKAVSKAADLATTSQSEADEKRGRAMRERDERIGRLNRRYRSESRACDSGDDSACKAAEQIAWEIEELDTARY